METLRFRNDAPARRRLWSPEAFVHPAKGHIAMWQTMIERYSQEGDTILDPMAGCGTSLIAALMGRNVVCVEKERHFVEPMRRSWEKMRQHPMLGYAMGRVSIIQGDARKLPIEWGYPPDDPAVESFDTVITSPPYEGIAISAGDQARDPGIKFPGGERTDRGQVNHDGFYRKSYNRPPVDAVITSPPYMNTISSANQRIDLTLKQRGDESHWPSRIFGQAGNPRLEYSESTDNIGNLRGAAYWEAMKQVYAECWRVLRPGGIMALVLKGYTRDGKYIDLPGQTEALLLAAGWQKHDHWRRELWSLSFWRILQKRRDPEAFDDRLNYEEVLAFRKPEALDELTGTADDQIWAGVSAEQLRGAIKANRVDAVITSPP